VLDAVVRGASKPMYYSVQDDGVVFSPGKPPQLLYSSVFIVDTNSLINGIGNSSSLPIRDVPTMVREYFSTHGVDWESPQGKAFSYNAKAGRLFVKGTAADMDIIKSTIKKWLPPAPQIHIKARFVEVPKGTLASISQLWSVTNRSFSGDFTGILYPQNFKTVYHALQAKKGFESLAEPEATILDGRQMQMRATQVVTVITNLAIQRSGDSAIAPQTAKFEIGPVLDVVPHVRSDGYKINLRMTASLTEFLGYADVSTEPNLVQTIHDNVKVMPQFRTSKRSADLTLLDGQTVFICGILKTNFTLPKLPVVGDLPFQNQKEAPTEDEVLVFVSAEIVDPVGNPIHGSHGIR
jgi:type II secretory pathway component GspD/PulD (secretin)